MPGGDGSGGACGAWPARARWAVQPCQRRKTTLLGRGAAPGPGRAARGEDPRAVLSLAPLAGSLALKATSRRHSSQCAGPRKGALFISTLDGPRRQAFLHQRHQAGPRPSLLHCSSCGNVQRQAATRRPSSHRPRPLMGGHHSTAATQSGERMLHRPAPPLTCGCFCPCGAARAGRAPCFGPQPALAWAGGQRALLLSQAPASTYGTPYSTCRPHEPRVYRHQGGAHRPDPAAEGTSSNRSHRCHEDGSRKSDASPEGSCG